MICVLLTQLENSRWRKQTRPTRLGSPPLDVEALNNDRLEDLELIEIWQTFSKVDMMSQII